MLGRTVSRRRLTHGAVAAGALVATGQTRALSAPPEIPAVIDVVIPAPFFAQGASRSATTNCGPAAVAAAVNFSRAAFPTVDDVRDTLGYDGPTDLDSWSGLLTAYGAPWYETRTQLALDFALWAGHVVVVAAWMQDLSGGPDYEVAWSLNPGVPGRYCDYPAGHALLVVGIADGGASYVVHDPNVFPGDGAHWYADGTPKGAYRKYDADELWGTVSRYADGLGLAVVPGV